MRFLFGAFFLVLTCHMTMAQTQRLRDIVYLDNGWILRGTLFQTTDSVGIFTADDNYFKFHRDQVRRIEQEPWPNEDNTSSKPPFVYDDKTGYYSGFAMSFLAGQSGPWGNPALTLDLSFFNGYRFRRVLQVGGGVGMSFYGEGPLLPIYAELRGDLLPHQMTPHYFARAGYAVALYRPDSFDENGIQQPSQARGGFMLEGGGGLKLYTRGSVGWFLGMGYRVQLADESFQNWGRQVDQRLNYRRINVQVALMF